MKKYKVEYLVSSGVALGPTHAIIFQINSNEALIRKTLSVACCVKAAKLGHANSRVLGVAVGCLQWNDEVPLKRLAIPM